MGKRVDKLIEPQFRCDIEIQGLQSRNTDPGPDPPIVERKVDRKVWSRKGRKKSRVKIISLP